MTIPSIKLRRLRCSKIVKKKYPDSLHGYTGNLLMVAINYDKKIKKYQCIIEKIYNDSMCRGMFSTAIYFSIYE